MSRRYGPGQVLTAAALWGTTGPVQVLAKLPVAPAAVGGMRILTGGLVLLAWAIMRRTVRGISRRHWLPLLCAAGATGVFQAAYFTSVSRTGAALATAIVFGVAPVATGLATRITDRSPLGRGWGVSTVCAVAGCILLLRPGHASRVDGPGVVLAVVAAVCYAVYTVSAKRLATEGAPMTASVSITLVAGGLPLMPWLATAGSGLVSERALLAVAWLGPVTTAVAYMLFVQGLRTVPAATAGTLSLAEPLVAATAGIGLLHENLTVPALIGCGLLAVGLVCASLTPPRPRPGQLGRPPDKGQGLVALGKPVGTTEEPLPPVRVVQPLVRDAGPGDRDVKDVGPVQHGPGRQRAAERPAADPDPVQIQVREQARGLLGPARRATGAAGTASPVRR